jgi:hypothetical protein
MKVTQDAFNYLLNGNKSGFVEETKDVFKNKDEAASMFEKLSGKSDKVDVSSTSSNKSFSFGDIVRGILNSQSEKNYSKYEGEFLKLQDIMDIAFDKTSNKFEGLGGIVSNLLTKSLEQILMVFEQQSDLQTEINTKTGLTGKLSEGFRANIMETSVYGARLNVSFNDISEAMSKILVDSGRFKIMSSETMNNIVLMSKVGFDNMGEAAASISEFQKVSRGASDAMEVVDKTVTSSLQLGLNAKQTTKDLTANIGKLNMFGFKDGVEGLRKMVQQAQALKMDLNASFELASKVMDPTDALSLSANLQVIGGALGDFNDPIKMMWMATNNVEGLQDALVGSLESLTSFNEKSGTFEIVGADLRRAKAMAEQFGMSLQDASNLAIQAAQRTSAATDMMSTGLVFDNEDDKEFLTNLAQMKGGRMVIEVPDNIQRQFGETEIALGEMTETQKTQLLSFREDFKKMSTQDIAEQQVNSIKNIERNLAFIAARARVELGKQGNAFVDALGFDPLKVVAETKGYADRIEKGEIKLSGEIGNIIKTLIPKDDEKAKAKNNPQSVPTPVQTTPAKQTLPPVETTPAISEKKVTVRFESDATMDTFKRAAQNEWLVNSPDAKSYLYG